MSAAPLAYLRAVRDSRDLSSSEKLVAVVVMSHAGPDGMNAHPGENLLAAETGLTEKTVRKHLRTLREKGWLLQVFSGRGGAHDRASVFNLDIPKGTDYPLADIPTGNGYRLEGAYEDVPTGNERPPNRYLTTAQPVTSDRPTGNGYRTNAPLNAPRNALLDTAPAAEPQTPPARQEKPEKIRPCRVIRRKGRSSSPGDVPGPELSASSEPVNWGLDTGLVTQEELDHNRHMLGRHYRA